MNFVSPGGTPDTSRSPFPKMWIIPATILDTGKKAAYLFNLPLLSPSHTGHRKPPPRDCEDLSFFYIGDRGIIIEPRQPVWKQVGRNPDACCRMYLTDYFHAGHCVLKLTARERHMCSMDTLRATMDVFLSKCLDGPGAQGYGGQARAIWPLPTSTRGALPTDSPHPVVLPPTYLLDISYSRYPPPPANGMGCDPYRDPIYGNLTGFCIGEGPPTDSDPTIVNGPISNGTVQLDHPDPGAYPVSQVLFYLKYFRPVSWSASYQARFGVTES